MKYRMLIAALLLLIGVFAIGGVSPASAHGRRTTGKYNLVVGLMNEPAILYQPNAVELRISDASNSEPVPGAQNTLNVVISQGDVKKEFPMRSRSGVPGSYLADFIPTALGKYDLQFVGSINEQKIDEAFDSTISDTSALEFPKLLPVGAPAASDANVLSSAQAAAMGQQLASLERQAVLLDGSLREAQSAAAANRLLAFGIIVIGALGFLTALRSWRRSEAENSTCKQASVTRA